MNSVHPGPATHPAALESDARDRIRVLKERARRIATPLIDPTPVVKATYVCFRVSGDIYAIQTDSLEQAFEVRRLTPLDGAPRYVRGVFSLNGRIVAAIDIRRLCGRHGGAECTGRYGVLVSSGGSECAVLADAIAGLRSIADSEIHRSTPDSETDFRAGTSRDGISILNGAKLLELCTRSRKAAGGDLS